MRPAVPELPAAALAALRDGQVIEAIKIAREHSGLGLQEAKDWVEAVQRSLDGSARPVAAPAASDRPEELPLAARVALQHGRKIEAIRIVRAQHGLGLHDAHVRIEQALHADSELRQRFLSQRRSPKTPAIVLAILVLLAFAVWRYLA